VFSESSSPVEKQKLLNGASVYDNTQDDYPIDDFENFNKAYTDIDLSTDSSAVQSPSHSPLLNDRSDLHHLLGSPVAEVEVFPHGSLQGPPKKGCLHFEDDILS
ncbi:unnamed protein product, partial [Meganyctiphanes norvegica]